jgi:hypothetical protein
MDYDEIYWSEGSGRPQASALTPAEIGTMVRLLAELRDLTLSRQSFEAASDFLRRFGGEVESPSLVRAEAG